MVNVINSGAYLTGVSASQNSAAAKCGGAFAETMAALSREASGQNGGIYHALSLTGQSLPLSEPPDYSSWDKESAYRDIVERYNLLNILTKKQASEMGLEDAYKQMNGEINNVLYGGDPFTMCASSGEIMSLDSDIPQRMNRIIYCAKYGITSGEEYERLFRQDIMSLYDADNFSVGTDGGLSDAFEIFNKLSDFDLTNQKTNLTRTVSGMLRGDASLRQSGIEGSISVRDYLSYREAFALRQYNYGAMSGSAYLNNLRWNDLIRELYSI